MRSAQRRNQQAVGKTNARKIPVAAASARVARAASAVACTGVGDGPCALTSSLRLMSKSTRRCWTGLLGNIGCKGVDKEPYYLGPREIKVLHRIKFGAGEESTKWVVAAEIVETTSCLHAVWRASTGMAEEGWRASDQTQLFRRGTGRRRQRRWLRGNAAPCTGWSSIPRNACITGR